MNMHHCFIFCISALISYVATALLYTALSTFIVWWLAILVTFCAVLGVACTDTYVRVCDVAATHCVRGVNVASSWLRARLA
jgi:hypothetical protein